MVLNNTNKNNSKLLEFLASVFTVSSYFPDNLVQNRATSIYVVFDRL